MDGLTDWLIGFVQQADSVAGLATLAGAAALEYVFPPFPGDTITLFGAVLITAYGWSFALVFGAVMAGSVAGAMLAFALGNRLRLHRPPIGSEGGRRLDRLVARFDRHGAAYLVINRFLPGIRTLFFIAAGLAGMSTRSVLAYSALSAALWNLGLIALGAAVGANFEQLLAWVRRYTAITWIVIGAILVIWLLRTLWRRRS